MWVLKSPSRIMEGDYAATPTRKPRRPGTPHYCSACRPKRTIPNPKAQGCDPLIHWGQLQHETAELGGNKQTYPSSPPLPVGHSRAEESPVTHPCKTQKWSTSTISAEKEKNDGRHTMNWIKTKEEYSSPLENLCGFFLICVIQTRFQSVKWISWSSYPSDTPGSVELFMRLMKNGEWKGNLPGSFRFSRDCPLTSYPFSTAGKWWLKVCSQLFISPDDVRAPTPSVRHMSSCAAQSSVMENSFKML
ncbi:hypothetical protein ILYODFUR_033873 [Ilyodon furcidens]|uniref:Uncharacterized protein n=1 Tax=Ilyodon furcidens TaxID=33524 RepID=A0ABV0UQ99_9TELE